MSEERAVFVFRGFEFGSSGSVRTNTDYPTLWDNPEDQLDNPEYQWDNPEDQW
jgi:hypothetical protein